MLWDHIKNFETIVWDWNGTLLDDHVAAWRAECRLFEKVGRKHLDVQERKKLFTMPVKDYYTRIGFDFEKMPYEQAADQWFAHYEEELKTTELFEGTRELLEQVRENGKKQFILSAAPESHLIRYTEEKDLRKYFHGIYGLQTRAADCKRERGRALFAEHALDAASALMIGDMVHDAEVAATLGCSVLLVADGHQDFETLLTASQRVLKSRFKEE